MRRRRTVLSVLCILTLLASLSAAGCGKNEPPQQTEPPEVTLTAPVPGTAAPSESGTESETTEEVPETETEDPYERRPRAEDSWFTEKELRLAGDMLERYFEKRGELLISVSFDQKKSPYLPLYESYESTYGGGNVMILEIEVKERPQTGAVVLIRNRENTERFEVLEFVPAYKE
ncbi:MAG: hypothetical protein IJL66_03800 [Lachnospiraceae bacterium]|nr:hypothetical protein [Lachnospiraceae bacterium]